LILSGNTLYGTTHGGGSLVYGTVFAVNTNGTGFTNLHSFNDFYDGAYAQAGLILSGNTLYGTTSQGGNSGNGDGTVFAVNTNGTGFTNLHSFGSDGAGPVAGLILLGNTLYGTAIGGRDKDKEGGSSDPGTVFALTMNGMGFTNLYSFTAIPDSPNNTNSDGAYPHAGLILSGNTLYGTALGGGSSGNGTVFAVHTDGTGFTNLHSFTVGAFNSIGYSTNSDGATPSAGLILSGNTLYGTASAGGISGQGTVFSLTLGSVSAPAPTLTIFPSGTNVVLTWPTNAAVFTLQATTNLVSPAVWSTVSPGPVVVNGQNTFIEAISDTQKFYRLSQ
jgi:uncharacterized repeat protein (TIGR03803 family)